MSAKNFKNLLCTFLFLTSLAACKTLDPTTSMPKGTEALPHKGFVELCARQPEECIMPMTQDTKTHLTALHQQTRELVIPTEEQGDLWQPVSSLGPGDCEDFALTLRRFLRNSMPEYAGAFRLATAYTEDFQYHAVITLETSSGTYVCDIRFPQCSSWEAFPYEWHLREKVGQKTWENIGDKTALANARAASIRRQAGR